MGRKANETKVILFTMSVGLPKHKQYENLIGDLLIKFFLYNFVYILKNIVFMLIKTNVSIKLI